MLGLPVRKKCFYKGFNVLSRKVNALEPLPVNDHMRAPLLAMQVAKGFGVDDVQAFACGDGFGGYARALREAMEQNGIEDVALCELRGFMGEVVTRGVAYAWHGWDYQHNLSGQRGLHVYLSKSKLSPTCRAKLKLKA